MQKYKVGQRVAIIQVVSCEPIKVEANCRVEKITRKYIYVVGDWTLTPRGCPAKEHKFDRNRNLDGVNEDNYFYILPQVD